MASITITDLEELLEEPSASDFLVVRDSSANLDKKVTKQNFLAGIQAILDAYGTSISADKQTDVLDETVGRLMINGAHGLGGDAPVFSGNCNSLTATSFRYCDLTSTNRPSGEAGYLQTIKHDASNASQAFITVSGAFWKRTKQSGTWGGWDRLFSDLYHPNADKLTTARTISLTGDVSGSTSFDGSANVSITATVADDSHNHIISNVDGLQTALDGKAAVGHNHDATYLGINANAVSATKLQTARTISLTGDVSGSVAFDGTTNVSITAVVADESHNHTIANVDGLQTALDGKLGATAKAVDSDKLDNLNSTDFARYSAAGTLSNALAADAWVANYAAGNVDHVWHDDATNTWHFCSDVAFKATGNSTIRAGAFNEGGTLLASKYLGINANAVSASKLATARTISLAGDATGSTSFDGSGNVSITVAVVDDSHNHIIGNVDGLQTALDGKLATTGKAADSSKLNGAVDATASTVNTIVKRDSSGDINARLFRSEYDTTNASVNYIMTQVDTISNNYIRPTTPAQFRAGVTDGVYLPIAGTAAAATKLATARTISLTGDVSGSVAFDGTANVSITATVADDSHNHTISNVDGLQAALDAKYSASNPPPNQSGYPIIGDGSLRLTTVDALSERSSTSTSYSPWNKFQVFASGAIRVSCKMYSTGSGTAASTRIDLDGVTVATLTATELSYTTKSVLLNIPSTGAEISVFTKSNSATRVYFKDLELLADERCVISYP